MKAFLAGLVLGIIGCYFGVEIIMIPRSVISDVSGRCDRATKEQAVEQMKKCMMMATCQWGRF